MDKQIKERRPFRARLTRLINESKAEMQKENPDQRTLLGKLQLLRETEEQLQELDRKVLDVMIDSGVSEADQDEELVTVDQYNETYLAIKYDIESLIQRPSSPVGSLHAPSEAGTTKGKRNFKLPKVELRSFDGDLKNWLGWWSQFKKIHEDEDLHNTDKFQYLVQSMVTGSPGKELVESYPQTGENYEKALEALQQRFGRQDLLLQVYIRELLTLVISNVTMKEKVPLHCLYYKLESHLRSLSALNLDKADPATWLFPLVESSLSEDTLRAWQRSSQSRDDGTSYNPPRTRLEMLMDFIKVEVQSEQQIQLAQSGFQSITDFGRKPTSGKQKRTRDFEEIPTAAGLVNTQASYNCCFCDNKHDSDRCVKAIAMTLEERRSKVKEKGSCFQCLKPGHSVKRCKAVVRCLLCNGKHYPLMCPKGISQQQSASSQPRTEKDESQIMAPTASSSGYQPQPSSMMPPFGTFPHSASHSNQCSQDVLLNTLQVRVVGGGKSTLVRMVGDTGSQRSYIKQQVVARSFCTKIGDEWLQNILFGGELTAPTSHGKFMVTLGSIDGTMQRSFELLEQQIICGKLPRVPYGSWTHELQQKGISITDQGEGCHDIEILLGNDYWGSILTGRIEKLKCGLIATQTIFGWTLGGRLPKTANNMAVTVTSMLASAVDITNLWSLESIGIKDPIEVKSSEDEEIEALRQFTSTVKRDADGRYVVSLPWKLESENVPSNLMVAEKRLRSATYKLRREGQLENYNEVFRAWEQEGFIETVGIVEGVGHFLPHRPVFKCSTTTPVRPVFDASSKSGTSYSLNECLHKGANLLELIPTLLLRFRERKVGVTADIRKAFQMLRVRDEDQKFQQFLWWNDLSCKTIKVFKHKRVVFGMNCSPFLLGATINMHLNEVEGEMKSAAEKLKLSFYVDNCVTSLDSAQEYNKFRMDSTCIMASAQMELRQWAHSVGEDEISLNQECRFPSSGDGIESEMCISVLGMQWDRVEDSLSCVVKPLEATGKVTKRIILSAVSQMFDPLGITTPATLIPKLIIQQSWSEKIGWDEVVPEEVATKFISWASEEYLLKNIRLERHMQFSGLCKREVHVFCDASQHAYAAVAFIRSERNGEVKLSFLLAKSRLAPMKRCTIPRLELMACLIGVRLAKTIRDGIGNEDLPCHYWSDSTTALAWIRRSGEFGVFVNNRCQEIRKATSPQQWAHVPGIFNPADLPSRGCSPKKLVESAWWEGPHWLRLQSQDWPVSDEIVNEEEVAQEKRKTTTLVATKIDYTPYFSSYRKNVAVWGWVIRFLHNAKSSTKMRTPYLTITEMRKAEVILIQHVQQESFPKDTTQIGGLLVHKDETGLLKVRTKLINRKDTAGFLSPVVLPKQHPIVDLLIQDLHRFYGHAGIQFLIGKLREKYWVIQSRRVVRRIIHRCVVCRRHTAKPIGVDPAALPERRVKNSEPFETTGVDLAGPLYIRDGQKIWVVLFTCAVFRCVYLDIVCSLSTEAFVGALERFVGTHGRPNTIYSDNGTNFVGAVNIFKELNWNDIQEKCNVRQIEWIFNPPTAAWWGGWWERLIKSVKDALKRMLGKSRLSYDQLRTCLAGVSATINDRPLTVVTEDNNDLIPLTPSMFMRRSISGHLPETINATALKQGYKKMKWVQGQLQDRFRREYLAQLVMRKNELRVLPIVKGDVVLVGADNKKRFEWPLGLVEDLLPGKDGKVRVARVKTAHGFLIRPLQRLYHLELQKGSLPVLPENSPHSEEKVKEEDPAAPVTITRKGRVVQRPRRYGQWMHLVCKC